MNATVKGIAFDAAGTLFKVAEPVGETYSRFAAKRGIEVAAANIEEGFRQAWQAAILSPPAVAGAERAWWRELVANSLSRAGAVFDAGGKDFEQTFADLFEHYAHGSAWRLFPETRAVVGRCAERLPLVVISNFDTRLHAILEDLDLARCFEAVVLSDELGIRKPDPRIFRAGAAAIGIDPGSLLHVGDDPSFDWHGAEVAGCASFKLDRPGNSLEDLHCA